ncbi:TetR/AcrR family transcriptional regulator [Caldicellulosiruptoraceae bacterium PP1]
MRKSEATREKIYNAAIKLISTNGYYSTTTLMIANEAGVSEATIFKYFKNKEDLLKEVFRKSIKELLQNVAIKPIIENFEKSKELPLEQFIKSVIFERLEMAEKNSEILKMLMIEVQYNKELLKMLQSELLPMLCNLIYNIEKTLILKCNISKQKAKGITRIIIGFLVSIVIQKYLLQLDIPEENIQKEFEYVYEIINSSLSSK